MGLLRISTASVVCAACGCAIMLSVGALRFGLMQAWTDSDANLEAYSSLIDVSGVRYSARDALLSAMSSAERDTSDSKLQTAIANILSVKPISSGYWLSLARTRFKMGEPTHQVMEAFSMSSLSGPNEGNILPWRSLFGVSIWDIASPDVRNETILGLSASLPTLTGQQVVIARKLIAQEPEPVRQEIRSLLVVQGVSTNRLAIIGL